MSADINDGFGNNWAKCALQQDCGLHVVRPGKADCWCFDCDESKAKYAEAMAEVRNLTNYLAELEDVCTSEQLQHARKAAWNK